MSDEPSFSFPVPDGDETTGRYIVTFREDSVTEGMSTLRKECGVSQLPNSSDFERSAMDTGQLDSAGGAVFPELGVAVATFDERALNNVMEASGEDSAILDVEPERMFYALEGGSALSLDYLRGFRDAVNSLFDRATAEAAAENASDAADVFDDDPQSTWGAKATNAAACRFSGRGIKVAVLDTGFDLKHTDFQGRPITSRSFIIGQDVQDGNGHGTHCIGTACGRQDSNGRRYGIAGNASIFAAKVLSNAGSGSTSGILAAMEWALFNQCQVISMSLGNSVSSTSAAYEMIGRRALQRGCLIVAAAGNARPRFTVGQPANSPSIMAVGAIDGRLRLARFSSRSGSRPGASVDISGPGVGIYSSWPMQVSPNRYHSLNGTSMATPHVAGIAALYAEATELRGPGLWQSLVARARRLDLPAVDAGCGLVQAPE